MTAMSCTHFRGSVRIWLATAALLGVGCGSSSSGSDGSAGAPGSAGSALGGSTATGGSAALAGAPSTGGLLGSGGSAGTHAQAGSGGTTPTAGTSAGGSAPAAGAGGLSATGGTAGSAGSTGATVCVAQTAVANMKLGWNLGNSLDVPDASKSDTVVETAWGNPLITAELLKAVSAAGFGAVRIPVTWIGRMGPAPSYTLSSAFIGRVEQVVKYALDAGLYVIVNIHHLPATTANTTAVTSEFKALWAQISNRFTAYGDHLVFESMNEVMVDYGMPKPEYYTVINSLNQAFVDTVRATGGNNATRCLVVPGYNTNIDYTVAGFTLPKDTSTGKLILSDHYYDPFTFAGSAETHTWGTGNPGIDNWGQEDYVKTQMAKLKSTFIDKGVPMILGEYGAVNQAGYENYRRYYLEYVTKAAHDVGITPFYWDNGGKNSGRDGFGLIDRANNTVLYPTVLQALTRAVTSNYALADVSKP